MYQSAGLLGPARGSYFFGSLAASLEFSEDGLKLAPYARGEFMFAKLDGYAEGGPGGQARRDTVSAAISPVVCRRSRLQCE
jgi:hypothetical protein